MRDLLKAQRQAREKLHLTFEISGQAAYRYDQLCDPVDEITVSNPSKMTWIYWTAKKNYRVDAHKRGPSVVRWLLVEATWRTISKSSGLRGFYFWVLRGQKARKNIAIIAVARKLLGIIRAMQVNHELFNEQLVCNECGVGRIAKVKVKDSA